MFRSAYLKLTAFYVATILLISLIFSIWVYREATRELETGLTARDTQSLSTQTNGDDATSTNNRFMADRLEEGRGRVLTNLVYFNLVILGLSTAVSYWLARRTMHPIETAMHTQNRFTADASHELRTPLATMKMELEVGLRDIRRTKQETEALLKSNLEEVDRLVGLSEGLLSLARDDESSTLSEVEITTLIKKLKKQFLPLTQAKEITIKVVVKNKLLIITDESGVERIVSIFIDNAIKYSPPNTTITVSTKSQKSKLIINVSDQGPGIARKDRAHIFERFYRADASRSQENVSGHGLGLAIAQKLAASMNAQLIVKSRKGHGSVFSLSLPR